MLFHEMLMDERAEGRLEGIQEGIQEGIAQERGKTLVAEERARTAETELAKAELEIKKLKMLLSNHQ